MKRSSIAVYILLVPAMFIFSQCNSDNSSSADMMVKDSTIVAVNYGGFKSQVEWGQHLVAIGHCNDCHTPKKMTPTGPVNDTSLLLSGHPAGVPLPDIDRREIETKGYFLSQTLTSWLGPWGVSFAANLTSDSTGIGNWKAEQFILCLREGKWKGLAEGRSLLPPMPWEDTRMMSDEELKAMFAYLKSLPPVKNVVPDALPPVTTRSM
ncbi:MAG: diheme cytochrome c-553 [Ginsengibacter sp.]